jgi:hypothetical protein
MAKPIKTEDNRDVMQSYILTKAKYDFSVYEKRIMYRLVEFAQDEIKGIKIRDNLHKIEHSLFGREITMPVADILKDEKDNNYEIAKRAFSRLSSKFIEYEDEKIWQYIPIITYPKIKKGKGYATFNVFNEIWDCILDFSQGYRKYELVTAMQFKSVYSMRFYELMSGQKEDLYFTIETLKEALRLNEYKDKDGKIHKEKYKRSTDFETYVLDVAKGELDKCSPYSFEYKQKTIRWRGRSGKKVIGYTFSPIYIQKNRDPKLDKLQLTAKVGNITGPYGMLDKAVSDYLLYNMNMTKEEINANKTLFLAAQKELPNIVNVLANLKQRAAKHGKGIGWIINGLKGTLKEKNK